MLDEVLPGQGEVQGALRAKEGSTHCKSPSLSRGKGQRLTMEDGERGRTWSGNARNCSGYTLEVFRNCLQELYILVNFPGLLRFGLEVSSISLKYQLNLFCFLYFRLSFDVIIQRIMLKSGSENS